MIQTMSCTNICNKQPLLFRSFDLFTKYLFIITRWYITYCIFNCQRNELSHALPLSGDGGGAWWNIVVHYLLVACQSGDYSIWPKTSCQDVGTDHQYSNRCKHMSPISLTFGLFWNIFTLMTYIVPGTTVVILLLYFTHIQI